MNLVKVANACAVECVRQKVHVRELGFLLGAYDWWYEKCADWTSIFVGEHYAPQPISVEQILTLGSFIEPGKNRHGFRKTPVTFQNGGSSCHASAIPEQMDKFIENCNAFKMDPPPKVSSHDMMVDFESLAKALTKEFLWIHPFADGNGRTGFLLWNWLMGTLDEPTALPDFNW